MESDARRLKDLESRVRRLNKELRPRFGIEPTGTVNSRGKGSNWLIFQNISVNYRWGWRLLVDGRPLLASKIKVFAAHIGYEADPAYGRITKPGGIGRRSARFQFPTALRYGIVLFQDDGITQDVLRESVSSADEFALENTEEICININDGASDAAYSDNYGAFDLHVLIVQ